MSFFDKLLGQRNKTTSVLGVDVGSSSLKVVQLNRLGGRAVLETYGELSLGPYGGAQVGQATNLPSDTIASTLTDLMREAKVTTNDCGVSIPFSRSLLTLVELPRRDDPAEQKTVIEFEARKYVPVPVTEVQLDWFMVPEPLPEGVAPPSKVKVLLVAVQNDELIALEEVVQKANLHASFFEIELFSTIRAVVDEPTAPVLVLDIGASATKAYVVEHNVVALSHNIPQGGQDVTRTIAASKNLSIEEAESLKKAHGFAVPPQDGYDLKTISIVFSRIFEEARRVLAQFETANQRPISAVVLTGGGGVTKELAQYAKQFFSTSVKLADPFKKIEAPVLVRPVLEAIGPEFAVAVGLALRKLEDQG